MRWTPEQKAILAAKYATTPTNELAGLLNHSPKAIRTTAQMMGLKKEIEPATTPCEHKFPDSVRQSLGIMDDFWNDFYQSDGKVNV